jgi:hypothetical protein
MLPKGCQREHNHVGTASGDPNIANWPGHKFPFHEVMHQNIFVWLDWTWWAKHHCSFVLPFFAGLDNIPN